ncbi:MAG: hypothetical protein GF334_04940 [Candidatus Altiarchaeales archaeon]|nr:hypothetical protein [Candidatus Altiarchaeales archaeon]
MSCLRLYVKQKLTPVRKKRKNVMPHPNNVTSEQFDMETLDKIPMEDKILLSREEDFDVQELTPGEIANVVNNALRDLPEDLVEMGGPEIAEVCFNVAYEVMSRITEPE